MEMKIDTKDVVMIINLCETAMQVESMEVESGPIAYWQRVQDRLTEWFNFYFKSEKVDRKDVEKLKNITYDLFGDGNRQEAGTIGIVYFSLKKYLETH